MRSFLRALLPKQWNKLRSMSKRQQWYELRTSMWVIPLLYVLGAVLLAFLAYMAEFGLQPGAVLGGALSTEYSLTQAMYSTMLSGTLTLNAFTFNSILVVLTSFSAQFTPRVLYHFITDQRTQHALGVFNLTFFFLLFVFFLLDSSMSQYAIFPIAGVLATSVSVINFILFINHATRWMQVSSITTSLKNQSKFRLLNTLVYDLEPYRPRDPSKVPHVPVQTASHAVASDRSGFLQVVDYGRLIQEARRDGIVLEMDRRMGDFVMEGIPLFHYWKTTDNGDQPIDEQKYHHFIYVGHTRNELQDLEFSIRKLTELAIKSIGNDEPMTAQEVIYQLTDLLLAVSNVTQFTRYLMDKDERVRLIMKQEEFAYYVYASYAVVAMHAEEDPLLTNSLLEGLVILSKAVRRADQPVCWDYARAIAENYRGRFPYEYDQVQFVNHLKELATLTGEEASYRSVMQTFGRQGLIHSAYIPA